MLSSECVGEILNLSSHSLAKPDMIPTYQIGFYTLTLCTYLTNYNNIFDSCLYRRWYLVSNFRTQPLVLDVFAHTAIPWAGPNWYNSPPYRLYCICFSTFLDSHPPNSFRADVTLPILFTNTRIETKHKFPVLAFCAPTSGLCTFAFYFVEDD